jgi:hypothetical protein
VHREFITVSEAAAGPDTTQGLGSGFKLFKTQSIGLSAPERTDKRANIAVCETSAGKDAAPGLGSDSKQYKTSP